MVELGNSRKELERRLQRKRTVDMVTHQAAGSFGYTHGGQRVAKATASKSDGVLVFIGAGCGLEFELEVETRRQSEKER
jgi:hypothetical protein